MRRCLCACVVCVCSPGIFSFSPLVSVCCLLLCLCGGHLRMHCLNSMVAFSACKFVIFLQTPQLCHLSLAFDGACHLPLRAALLASVTASSGWLWQRTWSGLRNRGATVQPPVREISFGELAGSREAHAGPVGSKLGLHEPLGLRVAGNPPWVRGRGQYMLNIRRPLYLSTRCSCPVGSNHNTCMLRSHRRRAVSGLRWSQGLGQRKACMNDPTLCLDAYFPMNTPFLEFMIMTLQQFPLPCYLPGSPPTPCCCISSPTSPSCCTSITPTATSGSRRH